MTYRVYLDSFTSMDGLPKVHWGNAERVLAYMTEHNIQRISTFEMTQKLMDTLNRLCASGKLVEDKAEPYPWLKFTRPEETR